MTINTKYLALLAAVLLLPASAFAQSYTSRAIIEVDKDDLVGGTPKCFLISINSFKCFPKDYLLL